MPVYQYEAIDANGKSVSAVIDAPSVKAAKDQLSEQGVMVLRFVENKQKSSAMKPNELIIFVNSLAQLLEAGIPLYETLVSLEEMSRGQPYNGVILRLADKVKGGTPLSEAMEAEPESFTSSFVAMVSAGQASGKLATCLYSATDLKKREMELKKKIKSSLSYPMLLMCFSGLVICAMLGVVVPSMEPLFQGRQLGTLTSVVMTASHIFQDYFIFIVGGIFAFVSGLIIQMNTETGKKMLERLFMRIPYFRMLGTQGVGAFYFPTMALLLDAGVPLVDAMELGKKMIVLESIRKELDAIQKKVSSGSMLSAEFKKSKTWPVMVSRMVKVGEDSGRLSMSFTNLGKYFNQELERNMQTVLLLLQPMLLLIMGAVVGTVMAAILLPLTDITNITT